MKIAITVHGKKDAHLTATMVDNETTRDFLALLPLKLQLGDLFGREKYGQLSKALSTKGKKQFTYKVGQIVYWSPSHDVAIYYKDDGDIIPSPGIIVMGQLDAAATPLNVPGTIEVTIDRAK